MGGGEGDRAGGDVKWAEDDVHWHGNLSWM